MHLIKVLKSGDSFYTESNQATVQAYSSNFKIKVQTEVVLVIEGYSTNPTTKRLTKVTII